MRINRKKLIDAMKEKNINHRELAELAGVTRMTVHNVKRGHNVLSHWRMYCKGSGCSSRKTY